MNYAFRNGKILDGTKEMKIQQGLCILVENGIITDLIPDANADLHNYKVIDLHGQYILPGLINMHVHLAGNGKDLTRCFHSVQKLLDAGGSDLRVIV